MKNINTRMELWIHNLILVAREHEGLTVDCDWMQSGRIESWSPRPDDERLIINDAQTQIWVRDRHGNAIELVPMEPTEAQKTLNSVMTAAEAASEFGLSESTVRQAINRKTLHARKSAETWLILRKDAMKRWGNPTMIAIAFLMVVTLIASL